MSAESVKTKTQIALVLIIIVLAFAAAGSGDYADAVDRENARLKADAAHCRLAASLREVQP